MHTALSLPELASRYHIADIYGATLAYFSSAEGGPSDLRAVTDRICCHELNLIRHGHATVTIAGHTHELGENSLLLLTPQQPATCHFGDDVVSDGLLIDSDFYDSIPTTNLETDALLPSAPTRLNAVYRLTPEQADELSGILQQARKAIRYSHLYKLEMIRSLVHVTKLFLSELPLGARVATADLRHKENIYKIFLHLADMNFRRERQMRFYADKLNISTTYLSRVVKEISGDTVNDHLTRRVFHEACNLLKASDRTMGEIARSLGFKDQSAFTNFFKLHAGCTPKAYRHR